MTSQKDQIQALIADIDGVLQKTTPRLPWVVSGEMTQQRQVLERVRNYLVTFQRRPSVGESYGQAGARPDLLAHDISYQPNQSPSQAPLPYQAPSVEGQVERSQALSQDELSAQQMLQAIVQDMGYLRANVMQPLQSDLERLRQQQEALVQEIQQLEAQRQGYAGQFPGNQFPGNQFPGNQQQVIAEFLQALMSRLQETLPQQVAQTLRGSNQPSLPYGGNLALSGSAVPLQKTSGSPAQGLGNVQVSPSQPDELLIKLDSTLSVVFESLQRNVQAYEESLSQGLAKMHSMGQQGEMMFTALISHLANQLGHEAASYLQPPTATGLQTARLTNPTAAPGFSPPQQTTAVVNPFLFEQPTTDAASRPLTLPFPGTELSSSPNETAPAATSRQPDPSVDTAIDSWLRSASSVDATSTADFELAELNLEGFDLNQLAAQDVNALLELDANLLSTNLPPQPLLAPTASSAAPQQETVIGTAVGTTSTEDTADIDAALKLLEQFSLELPEQPPFVADADAQIDRMLSTPASPLGESTTAGIPDDARDELDEFYESLFGNTAIAAESSLEAPATTAVPAVTDSQISAIATGEPAPAIAPLTTPLATPLPATSAVPQPVTPPVDTLPAETQAPTGTLVAPEMTVAPAISAVADPTLGWELLSKPATQTGSTQTFVTQAADTERAEPEIPTALLEDELFSGWDFEDAEMDLAEPAPVDAGNELLGVGNTASTSDRTPSTAVPLPVADTAPTVPSDNQTTTATSIDPLLSASTPTAEPLSSTDEITTLTDLFDNPLPTEGFGESIAHPTVPPQSSNQPSVNLPDSAADLFLTATTGQTASQQEDRLGDDRYTPASPGEDLLLLGAPVDETNDELWLDENTLNRLSEDLFSLEEAIAEPSLSYGADSGTDASVLYPDTATPAATAPAATAPEATAAPEALPHSPDESPTLEAWSASLNEFADALPTTEPSQAPIGLEPGAIAAASPEAFMLEGMDDLFADTPVVPPVTSAPPPGAFTQAQPSAFTLEGLDDLFADAPTDSTPLPPTFPTADQPPPFTLEGINDLFDDVPAVSSTSLPAAPEALSDQSLPFTLEGVDELFADAPPVADASPALPNTVTPGLPTQPEPAPDFTLETTDLFVPAPTAGSPPPDGASDRSIASSPVALPDPASESMPRFIFEQVGDLIMEVPSGGMSVSEQPIHEPAASGFPPSEQLSEQLPETVSEPALAPFTLERVGDVFIEKTSGATIADSSPGSSNPQASNPQASNPQASNPQASPQSLISQSPSLEPSNPQLPNPQSSNPQSSSPPAAEPSTLEQAFASLMGSLDEPPPTADGSDTHDPEKKK